MTVRKCCTGAPIAIQANEMVFFNRHRVRTHARDGCRSDSGRLLTFVKFLDLLLSPSYVGAVVYYVWGRHEQPSKPVSQHRQRWALCQPLDERDPHVPSRSRGTDPRFGADHCSSRPFHSPLDRAVTGGGGQPASEPDYKFLIAKMQGIGPRVNRKTSKGNR